MSILNRTKNIIKAQLADFEFSQKDPAIVIEQNLNDLKIFENQLKNSLAAMTAKLKLHEKHLKMMEEEQAIWLVRAEKAVGAGRDDLARQALLQKKSLEEEISKGKELRQQILTELELLEKEWQDCQLNCTKTQNQVLLYKHQQATALHPLKNEGLQNSRSLEMEFTKYHEETENNAEISALKNKLNNKNEEK